MRGALLLMETAEGGGKRVFIARRGDEDIACVVNVACGILRQSQTQRLAQEPMRAAIGVRRGEGGFLRAGAAGNPVEMLADEAQDVGGFAARRMREINFAVCFDGQAQTAVVAPWRTAMDAPGLSGVRDIENGRGHQRGCIQSRPIRFSTASASCSSSASVSSQPMQASVMLCP